MTKNNYKKPRSNKSSLPEQADLSRLKRKIINLNRLEFISESPGGKDAIGQLILLYTEHQHP
jgi:hypothetical protein